ncbi:MAG: hypothetical protein GY701_28705 [Sulfitobacter sp.]|nr:hypothetical protein [Sulfitobacter sp.]
MKNMNATELAKILIQLTKESDIVISRQQPENGIIKITVKQHFRIASIRPPKQVVIAGPKRVLNRTKFAEGFIMNLKKLHQAVVGGAISLGEENNS